MRRAPRARTQPTMVVNTSSQFRRGWVTTQTVVSDFGGDEIDMLGALEVGGGRHPSGRAHADDRAVTAAPGELEQRGSDVSNA